MVRDKQLSYGRAMAGIKKGRGRGTHKSGINWLAGEVSVLRNGEKSGRYADNKR